MTDLTLGLIYSIKEHTATWEKAVADFMVQHTKADIKEYNDQAFYVILKQAFLDYLASSDRPDKDVDMYMHIMERHPTWSGAHQIAETLACTTVRNSMGMYVNGFIPMPNFDNRIIEFDLERLKSYTYEYSSPWTEAVKTTIRRRRK